MKFVPVIHCPECGTPYTSAQLGFPFQVGARYTVICGHNDMKGRKCGCSCCFDFEVIEVEDKETITEEVQKPGILNKVLRKKHKVSKEVIKGSHLEVRAKKRGA